MNLDEAGKCANFKTSKLFLQNSKLSESPSVKSDENVLQILKLFRSLLCNDLQGGQVVGSTAEPIVNECIHNPSTIQRKNVDALFKKFFF